MDPITVARPPTSSDAETIPCALTIAGTDPSGAAGIQADLATFRELGVHGLSVITSVLWQNTQGVRGQQPLSGAAVRAQCDAVFEDVPVAAIKIGLLPTAEVARAVLDVIEGIDRRTGRRVPVVLDPVLVSGDGRTTLVDDETIALIAGPLLARVDLLTPNVPEAAWLLGRPLETPQACHDAALELAARAAGAILLKGGHMPTLSGQEATRVDLLARHGQLKALAPLPAIPDDVRGTGCHLSSAIAAGLARGLALDDAVDRARRHLNGLLHHRRRLIGRGRHVLIHTPTPQEHTP